MWADIALGLLISGALAASVPRARHRSRRLEAALCLGLSGRVFGQDTPLAVAKGERVELVMTNRTMMSHPMHLHGHVFQVVAANGARCAGALHDAVLVPPKTTVTIAFDADNPDVWAFHCRNLYHMAAGMMTTVRYAGI